jgi:hypothetical protein
VHHVAAQQFAEGVGLGREHDFRHFRRRSTYGLALSLLESKAVAVGTPGATTYNTGDNHDRTK